MPNFPVHDYGTGGLLKGYLSGLENRNEWGRQKAKQRQAALLAEIDAQVKGGQFKAANAPQDIASMLGPTNLNMMEQRSQQAAVDQELEIMDKSSRSVTAALSTISALNDTLKKKQKQYDKYKNPRDKADIDTIAATMASTMATMRKVSGLPAQERNYHFDLLEDTARDVQLEEDLFSVIDGQVKKVMETPIVGGPRGNTKQLRSVISGINTQIVNMKELWDRDLPDVLNRVKTKEAELLKAEKEGAAYGLTGKAGQFAEITGRRPTRLADIEALKESPEININLEKSTRGQLEKNIIDATDRIASYKGVMETFKPEFLTYFGKAKASTQKLLEKSGFTNEAEYAAARESFFSEAQQVFINYRKWATGVAGGEKELAEIAKATINPEKDSASTFKAKLNRMTINTYKLMNRQKMLLSAGIENPSKKEFASIPLESVPLTKEQKADIAVMFTGRQPAKKGPSTAEEYLKSLQD